MIDIWIIDGYRTHERHDRCMAIWADFVRSHRGEVRLHIYRNMFPPAKTDHDTCLMGIWGQARTSEHVLISEPDFLPAPGLAHWPTLDAETPIQAVKYVVRDARGALVQYDFPGAWGVWIEPALLKTKALNFWKSGPFNDPCNTLHLNLERLGQKVRLLDQVDCRPFSYAVETPGYGRHLFWSRHYGDDPNMVIGNIKLADVFEGVDRELDAWTSV